MAKADDYYLILGVSRDESPSGIRSAFRDLARRHHPDVAGPEGAPAFRALAEAYRVLSDPDARREYDARLGGRVRVRTEPVTRVRRQAAARQPFEPLSLLARHETLRPSASALLDRLMRNFTGLGFPKSQGPEPLFCDVSLSRDEARRGGLLPIRLPTRRPCVGCQGTGRMAFFLCRRCGGEGKVSEEIVVPLRVPSGVRSGAQFDVSLARWGIQNLWLQVRLTIR